MWFPLPREDGGRSPRPGLELPQLEPLAGMQMRGRHTADPRELPLPQMRQREEQAHMLAAALFPDDLVAGRAAPFLEVRAGAISRPAFAGQAAIRMAGDDAGEDIFAPTRGTVHILQVEGIAKLHVTRTE